MVSGHPIHTTHQRKSRKKSEHPFLELTKDQGTTRAFRRDEGVDTVYVDGCYETAPLWLSRWFDTLFVPGLEKKVKRTHEAKAK